MSDTVQHLAARRRVPVVRDSRAPVAKAATIAGPEWVQTKTDAMLAGSRVFDVRAFGDAESGDAVLAAMDAAASAGGGIVTGPRGTYTFTQPVQHRHNVAVDMPLGTVFDMRGVSSVINDALWYGSGALTALPALSGNVAQHATTITFAAAPGVVVGDWIAIYNSADASFHPARTYYRDGEFARVIAVSGNTVTLGRATYSAYPSATTTIHRMAPMEAAISGVEFLLPMGKWGVFFDLATRITLNNVVATGGNWSAMMLRRSVDCTLDNPRAFSADATDAAGVNYGLAITNCQNITVQSPYLLYGRHGFTTGGGNDVGCVPNRNLKIIGGTVGGTDATAYGCDLHGNTEYVTFADVSMPNGLQIAGDHVTYDGCKIWSASNGLVVQGREMLGADHAFTSCDFYPTANHPANAAFVYVRFIGTGHTREFGTFQFNASRIHAGAYKAASGTTVGVMVATYTGTDFSPNNTVEMKRNVVDSVITGNGDQFYSFMASADAGTGGFRNVNITDNDCGLGGPLVVGMAPEVTDVSRNDCARSPYKGPYVALAATGGYTNPLILCDGGQVVRAYSSGVQLFGRATDATIIARNIAALNNGRGGGTGSANAAGIYLRNAKTAILENTTAGDTQGTPSQLYATSVDNIADLRETDNHEIGTPGTRLRTNITSLRYQGGGTTAPEGNVFASPGSLYRCHGDGKVYRKATGTGTTGWKALADAP